MFQETIREFNHNLRIRLQLDNRWLLEKKVIGFWWSFKDDRGHSKYSAIGDAVIALSRVAKRMKKKYR